MKAFDFVNDKARRTELCPQIHAIRNIKLKRRASQKSQNSLMVNEILSCLFSMVYCVGVHRL